MAVTHKINKLNTRFFVSNCLIIVGEDTFIILYVNKEDQVIKGEMKLGGHQPYVPFLAVDPAPVCFRSGRRVPPRRYSSFLSKPQLQLLPDFLTNSTNFTITQQNKTTFSVNLMFKHVI